MFLRRSLHLGLSRLAMQPYSTSSGAPYLLAPRELQDLLQAKKDIAVLDATWFMPNSPRNAREEYINKHLPSAQFLDLDEVASSHELGLKHMLPSEDVFARACENFGINSRTHVVIYDTHGVFSSPRALYMFRSFGHTESSIINGGLPRWVSEGLPTESGSAEPPRKADYPKPSFDELAVRSYEQMVNNSFGDIMSPQTELVLDARSRGRYLGSEPEPRPGLSSGHIPNSFSLPFTLFLQSHETPDSSFTTFKPAPEVLKALEESIGPKNAQSVVNGEKGVITSCGSGMTAGILWLGLKLLGSRKVSLYDESWTGYAMRPESKIDKE
ncbi:thiosulfate sulfurtransferase [Moniliophthora roreri]|nr:thiosulfate sulfurtransferase [Moniliophthora roreri]